MTSSSTISRQQPALLTTTTPSSRTGRRDDTAPGALGVVGTTLLLAVVGWVAVWVVLEVGDVLSGAASASGGDPEPSLLRVACSVLLGMVVSALTWGSVAFLAAGSSAARVRAVRRTPSEPLVLALAGVVLAGAATALLHGTRWGMDGLYSDAGFRTQTVTRFADTAWLSDYAYRGLPSYYPPLLPWLQGRAADVLGVPGWAVMKPTQLLVCLVLPLASWVLWRRVVPGRRAAWVAGAVALATTLPLKPDEWLVLTLAVPWWLEVCRGVRVPGHRRLGAVGHGVVLGLLLLTHTYFFAPLAVATAIGMVVDLVRRRPLHPRLGPGLVTGVVAVLVASPSWVGPLWLRLQGATSDSLQTRWSPPGFESPPLPLPTDPRGVLEAVGVLWILWAVRRTRPSSDLAAGLLVALVAAYAFVVGGQLLQPLGVAVLPEKTSELVEALLAAAGALGLAELVRHRAAWSGRPVVVAAALVVVAVLGTTAVTHSLWRGAARPAMAAQHMRYPDGGFPAGGTTPPSPRWHPWGVEPGASTASVAEVVAAWERLTGRSPAAEDVVVSARADLSATVPVHLFVSWKSIYSHPQGRFADRLAVLEAVSRCDTSACAHDLLSDNDVEGVDGLVLNRDARGPYLTVTVDAFPDAWVKRTVRLDDALFEGPGFRTERLPGIEVVTLRER